MKFLIDAQLPRRLVYRFREAGFDAVHTLDLPDGNRTSDIAVIVFADAEDRIVVTKDSDFVDAFLLMQRPKRLLLISTGNITNAQLEAILVPNFAAIVAAFTGNNFIELTRSALIVHS
jgi:predicted nuclease of predicted toxin-antitoxin system